MSDYSKIIAVDFDGTLCDSVWPDAGPANQPVIDYVLEQKRNGAKIILWTNRTGGPLETAVKWCEERGLWFDAINDNLPEMIEFFGNNCRKVFANEYIDDRSIPMPGKPATNAIPATDAVEVVRCKDCKYYNTVRIRGMDGEVHEVKHCNRFGLACKPNDYCSYGERRSE